MAQAVTSRRLAQLLGIAAAVLLLCAGVALAKSGASAKRSSTGGARISEARALGGRCAARASRRGRPARRARCNRQAPRRGTPQPLYWGATIGSQLTGTQAPWDMGAVTRFEELAGKSASLVQFFQPFAECGDAGCSFYDFPTTPMESIRQHGSIPVLSWSSQAIPSSLSEPEFELSDLIEGRYDTYIREFAAEAAAWGRPFFLRFDWEMNGDWFPWAEGVNGNAPGQYVAAWRHVHDLFAAAGASNVSWVWCPFVDPGGSLTDVASLYPGDAYVDWTGLDGYNWGTNPASPRGWKSFDQLFAATYDRIAQGIAPGKPMMIAEMGSSEQGGSKSEWIRDALDAIPAEYPQVRAALWFDKFDDGMDWPIETSTAAAGAFAEAVQESSYVGAAYAGLVGGSIQPPS
ncbi:MAG TPA: glycosyl hydrolase [Solirubrobacterales bacterium]|jgi:beta-mannanase|nr:glycosyl hydrolase [Solirubrobacterales bacterium]